MGAMEDEGTKKPHAQLSDGHISPRDARWLATNVQEVNRSFKQILGLIDEEAEIFVEKSDVLRERRPQLISLVEDILHKHQLLAEQYEQLRRVSCSINNSAFNTTRSLAGFPEEYCFQTADLNSGNCQLNDEAPMFASFLRSDACSSCTPGKGGSEFSSLLSPDSDLETHKPSAYKSARSHLDACNLWQPNFGDIEEIGGSDKMLLGSMAKYEEELNSYRQKLQLSEGKVARLEKELEEVAGNLKFQLDSARSEIQKREAALEMEKEKEMELQIQASTLESQVFNSKAKIGSLEVELEVTKVKLEILEEEISNMKKSGYSDHNSDCYGELENQPESAQQEVMLLDAKLDVEKRQASEMQEKIQQCVADIADRDDEIRKLKAALQEATEKFSLDKVQFQSHISSLSEHLMLVEAKAEEWETSLQNAIQQREADKTEMEKLHEAQVIRWKQDIHNLKAELNEKVRLVELLNKDLDALKLKCDMLVAEKDVANAKIQSLGAELSSRDNQIEQMHGVLHQLHLEKADLMTASESAHKQYEDLRLEVHDLEKEVESQKVVILDRSEEKREAIRQLCTTMEHYRAGYEELRQVCAGLKRHVIAAS